MRIGERFYNAAPSAIIAINTEAAKKQARGERVFNLSIGEPHLPPHPIITAAAVRAIQAGKTLYPPAAGIPELRQAAVSWLNAVYGSRYLPPETVITCGAKYAIFTLCQLLLEPGAEAIVAAPYWTSYPEMVRLFGGVPRVISAAPECGWKITPTQLKEAITPATKIFIFNNAGNPTGALYTTTEVQELLVIANEHDVTVISDEVYSSLVYDDATFVSAAQFPEYKKTVVIVQSCSKHFAMTGWRVGMTFGPEDIINPLIAVQSQSTTGTSSISQWAALAAIERAEIVGGEVRAALASRRRVIKEELRQCGGIAADIPAGLYAFISLAELGVSASNSTVFCRRLLEQANVAAVPGSAFGVEGYIRLSFGGPETEIQEGIAKFNQFCQGKIKY